VTLRGHHGATLGHDQADDDVVRRVDGAGGDHVRDQRRRERGPGLRVELGQGEHVTDGRGDVPRGASGSTPVTTLNRP
jgi:hypothetical protein